MHFKSGLQEVGAALGPKLLNLLQQLQKTGPAGETRWGKIRAAKKRLEFRRKKNRERPPALSGSGLDEGHVNPIDIRPFFSIHFYANKMLFQEGSDLLIFERLTLH